MAGVVREAEPAGAATGGERTLEAALAAEWSRVGAGPIGDTFARCHRSLQDNLGYFRQDAAGAPQPPGGAGGGVGGEADGTRGGMEELCARASCSSDVATTVGDAGLIVRAIAELDHADNVVYQVEPIALTLAKAGAAHDFSPEVRGNGYWALCRVVTSAVAAIEAVSEACAQARESLFFSRAVSQMIEQLEEVGRELLDKGLRPLLVLALEFQRIDGTPETAGVFATGDTAEELLEQARFPERKVFFGRCIGFMHGPDIRKIVTAIASAMAAYSSLKDYDGWSAGMCLVNPASRQSRLLKVLGTTTDPLFMQAFWELSESTFLFAGASALAAPVDLIASFKIPAETIAYKGQVIHVGKLSPVRTPAPPVLGGSLPRALVPPPSTSADGTDSPNADPHGSSDPDDADLEGETADEEDRSAWREALGTTSTQAAAEPVIEGQADFAQGSDDWVEVLPVMHMHTFEPGRSTFASTSLFNDMLTDSGPAMGSRGEVEGEGGEAGMGGDWEEAGHDHRNSPLLPFSPLRTEPSDRLPSTPPPPPEFAGHPPAPGSLGAMGGTAAAARVLETVQVATSDLVSLAREAWDSVCAPPSPEPFRYPADVPAEGQGEETADADADVFEVIEPGSVQGVDRGTEHTSSVHPDPPPCPDEVAGYDDLDDFKVNDIPHFASVKVTLVSYRRRHGMVRSANLADREANGVPLSRGLVLHYHGGGFVSSTTKTHLSYLRTWAKALDCPVLSVDYSLAPQCPYPHALNECFFVYAWALANADKLGWTGEKVCVTGDSAGGNLAVAVGLKCVQESLRRPDGIVLFYPVLSVEISVSPSRFLSLMDPLLPQEVLLSCLDAYVGSPARVDRSELPNSERRPESDPLLSPLFADDDLLRGLPPVCTAAVLLDPLLDDAVAFAKRLRAVGNRTELQIYEDLCHGFLNFSQLNEASTVATNAGVLWIKAVLDDP